MLEAALTVPWPDGVCHIQRVSVVPLIHAGVPISGRRRQRQAVDTASDLSRILVPYGIRQKGGNVPSDS